MTRDVFAVTNEKEGGGAEITDLVVVPLLLVAVWIVDELPYLKSGCSLITSQTLFPSHKKLCFVGVVRT